MKEITFYGRIDKGLMYAKYSPELQPMVNNWKGIGTVRVFKDKVFIKHVSYHFFTELIKLNGMKFKEIVSL